MSSLYHCSWAFSQRSWTPYEDSSQHLFRLKACSGPPCASSSTVMKKCSRWPSGWPLCHLTRVRRTPQRSMCPRLGSLTCSRCPGTIVSWAHCPSTTTHTSSLPSGRTPRSPTCHVSCFSFSSFRSFPLQRYLGSSFLLTNSNFYLLYFLNFSRWVISNLPFLFGFTLWVSLDPVIWKKNI